jgi:hypothetical protein
MFIAVGTNRYLHRLNKGPIAMSPAACRPREGIFHNFDFVTVLPALMTTADCNFPVSIRFEQRPTCYSVFCSVCNLIQSGSILRCSAAEKRFLLFKGPGYLKKNICGNVEYLNAYQLKPLTPPSFFILQYL